MGRGGKQTTQPIVASSGPFSLAARSGSEQDAWSQREDGPCCRLPIGKLLCLFSEQRPETIAMTRLSIQRAEQFGQQLIASAPAHAMVLAQGDQAVFSLWDFQYAFHRCPDCRDRE